MLPFKTINIARYYHTLKHLKPEQIPWWAWYHLYRPRPDRRPAPAIWPTSIMWRMPAAKPLSMTSPDHCRFLNQEKNISSPDCWNDTACDKLWLYNLHYFDDLNAPDAEDRLEWHSRLIHRWITENPPGTGTGWEPYPLARRIVNWIKWSLSGNTIHSKWRLSLAVQTRLLFKRIERHRRGRRLFADAKALVFAGLFFEGEEARTWLDRGLAILTRELPEQILPDSGHFERSPMVQSLAVEDMLDLINLTGTYANAVPEEHRPFVATWPGITAGMRRCLALVCHPDGDIAFFNDATLGIAPRCADLEDYACRLGLAAIEKSGDGLTHLGDTGYIRIAGENAVALLDVAPIGPDYLTGHAHADTLSFELSLFERRVLVNSGTSEYGAGPERHRQRGTPAHNTVTVNDADSSEVWSAFRVARRASPYGLWVESSEHTMKVSCSHDGYRRLFGKPVHRRFWHFRPGELTVTDTIEGNFKNARARFHFHPDLGIHARPGGFSVDVGEERQLKIAIDGGNPSIEATTWHPELGQSLPNQCLDIAFNADKLTVTFSWTGGAATPEAGKRGRH